MKISPQKKAKFQETVWDFYRDHGRDGLPWRKAITPYRIWISEVMLQQTQVDRVIPFFKKWMQTFPSIKSLANASQSDLLKLWKGLGYNSRALRLKRAAEMIMNEYGGKFPKGASEMVRLPGIGNYTAGAIQAFAFDEPSVFIETNIRRVFIHHFFQDKGQVSDREILEVVQQMMPRNESPFTPRHWYYALMDYGAHLAKTISNPNKKSRHYTIQKKFKGSDREIRGKILELLLKNKKVSLEKLVSDLQNLSEDYERIEKIIDRLHREGFLEIAQGKIFIKK